MFSANKTDPTDINYLYNLSGMSLISKRELSLSNLTQDHTIPVVLF